MFKENDSSLIEDNNRGRYHDTDSKVEDKVKNELYDSFSEMSVTRDINNLRIDEELPKQINNNENETDHLIDSLQYEIRTDPHCERNNISDYNNICHSEVLFNNFNKEGSNISDQSF